MAVVFSYVRFSSRRQIGNDSVRRQTKALRDWLSHHPEHVLDDTLRMRDLAVSGFRGANLDPDKGDLGKFVALAKQKESPIPPNSILALENLDRFSRLPPRKAYTIFCELVEAGVSVLTLDPLEMFNHADIDDMASTLSVIIKMQLNYEKSKRLSGMIGKSWEEKRRQAQAGKPLSPVCPSWLVWDKKAGQFKVKPEGKRALQYIFQQTADGIGQKQITYELNERYKPLGRGKVWHTSFVGWVLSNRQVLGEFQPKTRSEDERIPDGKPITGYYPAVIPEDLFLRANAVRVARRKQSGRHTEWVNLLVGLVWGRDGYPCHIKTDKKKRRNKITIRRAFQSLGYRVRKADACPYSVPSDIVEKLVLASLDEVRADDFKPTKNNGQQIGKVVMELAGVEARMTELADMLGNPALKMPDEIGKVMSQLSGRRDVLRADVERLKQEQATTDAKPLEQFHTIFDVLKETEGKATVF